MESAVFLYFVAIGAGLAFGIGVVVIPSLVIIKRIMGGGKGAKQVKNRANLQR